MTLTNRDIASFGALLKDFRTRRHLTQQQLAEAIGVHRHAIGRWEQGDFLPASKAMVLELARHLFLDEPETRQLLEASLTALSPHWLVPFQRNLFFTGREEILEALHIQLGAYQAVSLTQSSALHGLGGVGKTQIALEYVYRHALEYGAVFWIGAETSESIVSGLLRIAEVLQLPGRDDKDQQRVVAAVQHWLTTHSQWLLIWDNVEDLGVLDRFLPSARQGAVLLTTRRQALGTLAQGIDLSPMEHEEGMLFLLRRAKVLEPEATHEHLQQLAVSVPGEYVAAEKLVSALGGLPLALDQAGAYIDETGCSVSDYLQRYEQQHAYLLDRRGSLRGDHPHSVAATFRLSMEQIEREQSSAADLLRVCALLHAEAIPEELFVEGAVHLGPTFVALATDPCQLDQAIAVLRSLSLVQRQPETHTLSLHRLVQAVLKGHLSEAVLRTWMTRVLHTLSWLFPSDEKTRADYWPVCERLLPHALVCLAWSEQGEEEPVDISLMSHVATYLSECSRYAEAESLFQRALRLKEHMPGSEQALVAEALSGLAVLRFRQGQYAEAELLFQRAIRLGEQTLGAADPQVATSLAGLAILYGEQGKYAQAESLYRRALRIRERTLGVAHPQIAALLNNLAYDYKEQGKYAQAEPLFQRTLLIWERALGPAHPRVGHPLHNLAELFKEQGKYAQAEPLFQRALLIWEQALGPEHRLVAEALHGLACLYREQGKYAEAEPLFQRALRIREQLLGQHHPATAQTLHDLALFRQKQGNLDGAISLAERALKICSQSLGDTHPKTLATRTLYSQLLQEQGCVTEEGASELSTEGMPDPLREEHDTKRATLPLREAVDPSLSEKDFLQGFLDARCELHPRAWSRAGDLWQAYERWAEEHQERFLLSRRAFLTQLKAHGCRADRTNTARIWRGITIVKKEP